MPNRLATSRHARSAIYCSPSYIHLASVWLKECVEEHSICAIPDSAFMPNRLVDVGLDTCEPFLIDSKIAPGPYVVLSYCWGTVQNTVTTTRENIADHRRCIPLLSLPRVIILSCSDLGFGPSSIPVFQCLRDGTRSLQSFADISISDLVLIIK